MCNRFLQMILAMISSVAIIVSFTASVFAATRPNYSLDEWQALTREEIYNLMVETCADNGGTYKGTVNDINGMGGYALYRCYRSLNGFDTTAGSINGVPISTGDPASAKFMLSQRGLADFGDGNYKDNGHSSNSFSEEMNDRFDEYQQEYPYSGINNSVCYKFPNGYYISWEPLQGSQGGHAPNINGVVHYAHWYNLRFYLHNESGKIIDIATDVYNPPVACDICQVPYENFTILPGGKFSYIMHNNQWEHLGGGGVEIIHSFPWYSDYGEGEEDEPPVTPIPITLYNIDNGDTIYAYREGDQINYNNNYYDYGDTVTIGGNTYSVYYDYRDMSEDYLNEFYNYVYNYYYDNIGTDYKFDDSAILEALRAIYDKLQAIFNKLQAGFRNVTNKLNDILKQLKDVNASLDDITEKDKEDSKALWLELISDFKKKISYDDIETGINNIQTAFFAKREFSSSDDGTLTVEIKDKNDVVTPSTLPKLSVTLFGKEYNLYGDCIKHLGSEIETIKGFIGLFLVVGFLIMLFRSAPGVIASATRLSGEPSNVSVEAYRSKYD